MGRMEPTTYGIVFPFHRYHPHSSPPTPLTPFFAHTHNSPPPSNQQRTPPPPSLPLLNIHPSTYHHHHYLTYVLEWFDGGLLVLDLLPERFFRGKGINGCNIAATCTTRSLRWRRASAIPSLAPNAARPRGARTRRVGGLARH